MKKKLERLCTVAVARLVRRYSYLERLGIASAILVDFNEGLSPVIRASGDAALAYQCDNLGSSSGCFARRLRSAIRAGLSCVIVGGQISLSNAQAMASADEKTPPKETTL